MPGVTLPKPADLTTITWMMGHGRSLGIIPIAADYLYLAGVTKEIGRVQQGFTIPKELLVGVVQVFAFALVLPGEAVLLPDVRPALAAAMLGDALLEGEPFPLGVGHSGPDNT